MNELAPLRDVIRAEGFALVGAEEMRPLVFSLPPGSPPGQRLDNGGPGRGTPSDWESFAETWNDLPLDTHLPDGHRYRRRRHATLSARAGEDTVRLEPHQPHYQSLDYNSLVGGIERWFEPIGPGILAGPTMARVLGFCLRLYGPLRPQADWHIEAHQFRIEARPGAEGLPTPEGVHRDGVDYVLVLLVNRTNIESGTTTVHGPDGALLGSFTLSAPLDAALVDDARVRHGVTAVRPIDPARPAFRDVLVVTMRARN
jgi:hypothetical protein